MSYSPEVPESADDRVLARRRAFGQRLRDLRKQAGLTQAAIATATGLSRPYYTQVELGNENISLDNQFALADALGVEIGALFPDPQPATVTPPQPSTQRDILSKSLAGAPYSENALAELIAGEAMRELSDFARAMVPTGRSRSDENSLASEAEDLRRLLYYAQDALAKSVVAMFTRGATWEQIADIFEVDQQTAQTDWGSAVTEFATYYRGQVRRFALGGRPPGEEFGPAEDRVARLEKWLAEQRRRGEYDPGVHAVAERVRPMSMLVESMFLSTLRDAVRDEFIGPPAELMLQITLRAAELDEAIAACERTSDASKSWAAAARHRAYARELAAELPAETVAPYLDRLNATPALPIWPFDPDGQPNPAWKESTS
ncbi:helix-turn-helix domain-containing protein [Nocardia sp. NPDC052566]|uniref:helix-turn-helix domain-containing protein n=1 Tax=Nocardia sp. NPDC052566 TaxID=3364330 RepID=UPI0037CC0FDB